MNLDKFPRRKYTSGNTPIEEMSRLSESLNGPRLFIKRDDRLELAGGGNKTRKLEFAVGEAVRKGATSLITCGGLQSNHCRLTAAAAVKEGLECYLVLIEEEFQKYDPAAGGNNLLYNLLGVKSYTIISVNDDWNIAMQQTADQLRHEGKAPYIIPMGASNPVGTLGYISCAQEIIKQSEQMEINFDYIVCPCGSAGTQSGLIIGMQAEDYNCKVIGISVSRSGDEQEKLLQSLISDTIDEFDFKIEVPESAVKCFGDYVGPGYAQTTPEMVKAVKLCAATEGILLDPVYTGKAMAGLIDLVEKGYFKKEDNVLFLHTGGAPGLFAKAELFLT